MITPKEKAEELVGKYVSFAKGKILFQLTMESAKQCALIAVEEIIKAIPDASDDDSPYNHELVWWQEVEKEIETL